MVTIRESDKIIFVNIKNSYEALLNNDRSNPLYRDSVYNCTVKYWRIANEKSLCCNSYSWVLQRKSY